MEGLETLLGLRNFKNDFRMKDVSAMVDYRVGGNDEARRDPARLRSAGARDRMLMAPPILSSAARPRSISDRRGGHGLDSRQ